MGTAQRHGKLKCVGTSRGGVFTHRGCRRQCRVHTPAFQRLVRRQRGGRGTKDFHTILLRVPRRSLICIRWTTKCSVTTPLSVGESVSTLSSPSIKSWRVTPSWRKRSACRINSVCRLCHADAHLLRCEKLRGCLQCIE